MTLEIIGIRYVDPSETFGILTPLVIVAAIATIVGFFIAGVFIFKYNKKLSEVGEVPKGWTYFFAGLMLNSLYQTLKVPFTFKWVFGTPYLLLFSIFQVFVVIVLVYGLYLLKKGVELK